jgi:hypothetical protein
MNLRKYPSKKWFKEQSKKLNDPAPENKEVTIELTEKDKQLALQIAEKHRLTSNEVIQIFDKALITISLDRDFESEKTINDLSEFITFIQKYIIVASDNEEPRLLFSVHVT